jgi:Uma2 family endonuclease
MAMGVETLISVEEYLHTSYDPDVEYVDGVLVERNVGDWLHSLVQSNLIIAFSRKYPNVKAVPALRAKVKETRYRLPDVSVLLSAPQTKVLLEAPFVAIEILWEADSMSRVIEKLKEYAGNGTPHIWVFDPRVRLMFTFQSNSLREVEGDAIATVELISTDEPRLELTRAEVFQP